MTVEDCYSLVDIKADFQGVTLVDCFVVVVVGPKCEDHKMVIKLYVSRTSGNVLVSILPSLSPSACVFMSACMCL